MIYIPRISSDFSTKFNRHSILWLFLLFIVLDMKTIDSKQSDNFSVDFFPISQQKPVVYRFLWGNLQKRDKKLCFVFVLCLYLFQVWDNKNMTIVISIFVLLIICVTIFISSALCYALWWHFLISHGLWTKIFVFFL